MVVTSLPYHPGLALRHCAVDGSLRNWRVRAVALHFLAIARYCPQNAPGKQPLTNTLGVDEITFTRILMTRSRRWPSPPRCSLPGPGRTTLTTAPSTIVTIKHITEDAEQRTFFATTTRPRCIGKYTPGQARDRQRLQPDLARPPQRRKKQSFAAKYGGLQFADILNIKGKTGLKTHHTSGVDAQDLTRAQVAFRQGAAGMHKGHSIALEFLHHKSFATEQSRAELLLKSDA